MKPNRRKFIMLTGGLVMGAGCLSGDNSKESDGGDNSTDNGNGGNDGSDGKNGGDGGDGKDGNDGGSGLDFDSLVFDHGSREDPLISGGTTFPAGGEYKDQNYITMLTDEVEKEWFNRKALQESGDEAKKFVDDTDLSSEILVVIQSFPESSSPDYKVNKVVKENEGIHLYATRESDAGTDDLTIENMFVRVKTEKASKSVATLNDKNAGEKTEFSTEDYLQPKRLPQKPEEVTGENVVKFAEGVEKAYKWNQEIDPDVTELSINIAQSGVQEETENGYIVHLEIGFSKYIKRDGSEMVGDGFYTANYYIDSDIVKRAEAGGQKRPGPDPRNGEAIRRYSTNP